MVGAVGCASRTTALRVGGTDGAEFTVYYDAPGQAGAIRSVARPGPTVPVIELPGGGFRCDIRKEEPEAELHVEVYRGQERVFETYLPPGIEGARIRQVTGTWRASSY
jgi:hypothetical protein